VDAAPLIRRPAEARARRVDGYCVRRRRDVVQRGIAGFVHRVGVLHTSENCFTVVAVDALEEVVAAGVEVKRRGRAAGVEIERRQAVRAGQAGRELDGRAC